MSMRFGELLISRGILNQQQVDKVLEVQKVSCLPFGRIAADLFSVPEAELWRAWATQMVGCFRHVDIKNTPSTPEALAVFNEREAWGFRLLPISIEDGSLTVATSDIHLPTAMAVAQIKSEVPPDFVLADIADLQAAIKQRYNIQPATKAA